ncbi:hypothetical protein SMC26_10920 [Actinomadura fulvescens]|uniref:Uncharacterized protein n=1 Tax=Actinomadura fulvescens TaxID=46160 RepID=A0ABP6CBL7_9ACTN
MNEFGDRVLVRCPRCDGCAVVLAHLGPSESMRGDEGMVKYRRRVRCPDCGLFKDGYLSGAAFGMPVDPYFRFSPLWLRARCRGPTLWTYKPRPVGFAAGLRFGRSSRARCGPLAGPGTSAIADLPRDAFPHMAETARSASDEEFHDGLTLLLNGIDTAM